jgi:competence protein ComEA
MHEFVEAARARWQGWMNEIDFGSAQKKSLIAIFIAVALASTFIVTRGRSEPIVAPAPIVVAPVQMTIDVSGGVKQPGVYSLPANSRVVDAIAAAGGANSGTDLSDINLARILKDGEQIYVEPAAIAVKSYGASPRVVRKSGPININRATAKELDALPGIGPVLAARIVAYRKTNGPFSTIEDLQKVSGIGGAKFTEFKSKVRV